MGERTWTEERTDRAREMWFAGYSATQIACDLGGITRNAVIGKIHRIRAGSPEKRKRNSQPKPKVERKARPPKIEKRQRVYVAQLVAKPKLEVDPIMLIPSDTRTERALSFDQAFRERKLTPDCCKWIVGHVDQPDWFYCGEPAKSGPYCLRHAALAYIPARTQDLCDSGANR